MVDDCEFHRTEKGYTYESMEAIQEKYPDAELYFLAGGDKVSSDIAAVRAGHGKIGLLLMVLNTFGSMLPIPRELLSYPLYQWKREAPKLLYI